jgi:hypothetical protein
LSESESKVEVAVHTKCQWTNNEKTSVIFPFISFSGGVCKDLVSKYDTSSVSELSVFLEIMNLLSTVAREINDYAKKELQNSEKKKRKYGN